MDLPTGEGVRFQMSAFGAQTLSKLVVPLWLHFLDKVRKHRHFVPTRNCKEVKQFSRHVVISGHVLLVAEPPE